MNEQLKVIISAEVEKLKQGVEQAKQKVNSFKEQVKKASAEVDTHFKAAGQSIANAAKTIGVSLAAAGTALLALAGSTEEYRNQQAQLITAFEAAGASANVAKETYNDLYRVLGDGGQAQEAAQHLAKLTTEEKALSEWTNICQGVYATFGASLPIEGLTEAANETAKVGTVTGSLADALNWAGISEDAFNEKLEKCNTEAEREKLIRETLNGLYSNAAATYEKNNAQVLAQRDAQAKLQETLAKLGEALAPVITLFTQFATDALAVLVPHIQSLAENFLPKLKEVLSTVADVLGKVMGFLVDNWEIVLSVAGVIGAITAAIGLYNAVAAVKAAMAAAEVTTVWALVSAYAAHAVAVIAAIAPYLLIVAAIAAVIAIIVLCVKHWDAIKEAAKKAWEGIKNAWNKAAEWFKGIWDGIKNAFSNVGSWFKDKFTAAWNNVKGAWDKTKTFFSEKWNNIKDAFANTGSWFKEKFSGAWNNVKNAWSNTKTFFADKWGDIKNAFSKTKEWFKETYSKAWENVKLAWSNPREFFNNVKEKIQGVFSSIDGFFGRCFGDAWTKVKNAFSGVAEFFSGVFNKIKDIFSKVGTAIATGIKGAVSSAVNKVLSTACSIINGFISAINVAIGVINVIPGVNIRKLNKLSVPAMAQGGVVDGATLALIGERGKEAVVPLENNLGWLDKLATMLNDRMDGNTKTPAIIQLTVDGRTLGDITIENINALTKQRGSLPLVLT